jgi:hypothetical protein
MIASGWGLTGALFDHMRHAVALTGQDPSAGWQRGRIQAVRCDTLVRVLTIDGLMTRHVTYPASLISLAGTKTT